jgi:ribosomal protein S18 acetylase RimI-like enzyme
MPEPRTFVRPDGRCFVVDTPDSSLPPGELFATVDESDDAQLQAFEALGFSRERRELELVLPTAVPRVPAPPGVEAVRADEVDEETLRLLDDELRQDVPGTDGWRWTAAEFREGTYGSPHFDPAVYLVATCQGEHVGICRVWVRPEQPRLGFVGVRRSHRGQGIARWLIGEAFSVLHARGEREVWAEVDETNVASRTLLEGLGGRRVGASLELRRPSEPRPSRAPRRTRT